MCKQELSGALLEWVKRTAYDKGRKDMLNTIVGYATVIAVLVASVLIMYYFDE